MRRQGQGVVRRAWAVAAVVAVVVAGGCTGEPGPAPTAAEVTAAVTADPSPAPSPPPRPETPERPEAMSEPTPEGAIAAATYFLQVYDHAFSTGDESYFVALSGGDCLFCSEAIAEVAAMRGDGSRAVREPIDILHSSATEVRADEWFNVELRVRQGRIDVVSSTGEVTASAESEVVDVRLAMSWAGGWTVDAVDLAPATS
ncbi:DUF6318 family protein [Cellulomonas sp. S1-8]|uniref:DUF6318 family protein n=1 Tax=Cellulomonas sp. S1-8 TaxID=2904790 RepID=UPI0022435FE5|nr:DUF6318 family protein [Cellulomonas sp. S1-8]UZN03491.1 DUF6318 family protein [Cellulomonas sp. S1-8]